MAGVSDSNEFDYTPGYTKPTHEHGAEFGDEFHAPAVVELLASMVGYRQRGVTLAGGQGVLPTGCVLAKKVADSKYYAWKLGAVDGTQTAIGFLRNGRDTGGASSPINLPSTDCQGNLVYSGALNLALLSGTDNNNVVGAGGGFGSNLVTALGGHVVNFGSGTGTGQPFGGSVMDQGNVGQFIF